MLQHSFTCNSTTNANQSATITVAPTGGGTYTYSYDNGGSYGTNSTLTVNDNGTTQTFQIYSDASGCRPFKPLRYSLKFTNHFIL
jgi:spore coat protein U-like protein